jgi:hypothetical protein
MKEAFTMSREDCRRQGRYQGFGPTLTCEYLAVEQQIRLSRETLRQRMIGAHLWHPGQRRKRLGQRGPIGDLISLLGLAGE